jgi:2-polyprenyl-6-methoxyphenol hydroxylase-like FAD-dependent oxidoreductase
MAEEITTGCCIVGGGPAGMMAGYMLARGGIDVIVLEKHADFLRDFRGDTVHPSTMEVLSELGLLSQFLERPHQELSVIKAQVGPETVTLGDFSRLKVKAPFIALMPQWDFLNFLAEKARLLPNFRLLMSTEGTGLIEEGGIVTGARARGPDGDIAIRANLVIAADGRHSTIRTAGGFKVHDLGAPIDVLWFRIGRDPGTTDETLGRIDGGRFMVTINRGDYWQCAFVIPKGRAEEIKADPIADFRRTVLQTAPHLASHIDDLSDWDGVKLLSVTVDRLERWAHPGLLCIGDAAHAMSPVGGVGINMAIQDAVAAANLLVEPLRRGRPSEAELDAVQHERLTAVRLTQALQVFIQDRVLVPTLAGRRLKVPAILRLLNSSPALQGLPARAVGLGYRPEHVSPAIVNASPSGALRP